MSDFKQILDNIIRSLDYTEINLEIGWQIELIIKLREKLENRYKVIPEKFEPTDTKKELDIAITENGKSKYAIELKMPQHNAFKKRWENAKTDISFLKSLLLKEYEFGYLIFLTPNECFWKEKEICSYPIEWKKIGMNGELKYFIIELIKNPIHQVIP